MIRQIFSITEVISPEELNPQDREDMYQLFSLYYTSEGIEYFLNDLNTKTHVFLLRNEKGIIKGFSSLLVYESFFDNRKIQVFFSGDTIIHKDYRGGTQFPELWIRTILSLANSYKHESYWFLISGGHRTYRYLPLFCKKYYPGIEGRNANEWKELAQHLAEEMFHEDFIKNQGIIRFTKGATPLIPEESEISPEKLKKEHIHFFQKKNPLHSMGDELVCIALINESNLTKACFRITGARQLS